MLGSFGVPSVGPMLLNISIIGGLFAGVWAFGEDKSALAYSMCASWLVGGLLQAALPAYWLHKKGWKFHPNFGKSDALNDLYKLFLPALLGAAIIQLNIFVSKILALFINDAALPSVYLSGRILEFPLGVFAVAIATVYFPKLSKLNSPEKIDSFKAEYSNGLVFTMCISIPGRNCPAQPRNNIASVSMGNVQRARCLSLRSGAFRKHIGIARLRLCGVRHPRVPRIERHAHSG